MIKKSTPNTADIVNPEHEQLIQVLKFTPRTYKLVLWGYGGETVMGTVSREIYDYFRQRRLDVGDFAWDSDYADEHNIPEDMWPFPPGSWYECDNMGHATGADRAAATLQILDENDNTVFERSIEDCDGYSDDSPQLGGGDEVWIDSQPAGTVVFIGRSNEKGTFFEGEIELKEPFDISKLELGYDEIDGNEIINTIVYDGEEIENYGGSTDGKSSDFGFYIAHSCKSGTWEKYTTMDDIDYKLSDWYPAKSKPVREGKYQVETKDGYKYYANWNGKSWHNDWSDAKIAVVKWQGVAYDPDEHFLRKELDDLVVPDGFMICGACGWTGTDDDTHIWDGQDCCPNCGEAIATE